jgi:hypothetical protein
MMPLVSRSFFLSGRPTVNSTGPIKANPPILLYPRMVRVGIVKAGANVPARGIIKEMAAFPMTAPEAGPEIAKSIVNSAVESDLRSPIAGVPKVASIPESKETRSQAVVPRPQGPSNSRRLPRPNSPESIGIHPQGREVDRKQGLREGRL